MTLFVRFQSVLCSQREHKHGSSPSLGFSLPIGWSPNSLAEHARLLWVSFCPRNVHPQFPLGPVQLMLVWGIAQITVPAGYQACSAGRPLLPCPWQVDSLLGIFDFEKREGMTGSRGGDLFQTHSVDCIADSQWRFTLKRLPIFSHYLDLSAPGILSETCLFNVFFASECHPYPFNKLPSPFCCFLWLKWAKLCFSWLNQIGNQTKLT